MKHDDWARRQHPARPAGKVVPGLYGGTQPARKAVRRGQAAPLVPCASRRPGTADRPARPAGRGGGGMTGHSVEKIGGTSMAATATLFDNVLIGGRSEERRVGKECVSACRVRGEPNH